MTEVWLFAALAGAIVGSLGLAPLADESVNAWRLRRRAALVSQPLAAKPGFSRGRSSAAPILRTAKRASDAVLEQRLPGGAAMAAALATANTSLSLSSLALLSTVAVAALAGVAVTLGVPLILACVAALPLVLAFMQLTATTLATRARSAFAANFPDAVAIMIRALRAGLPVAAAISEVARGANGPVGTAFASIVEDMRLGQPVDVALWAAARRIGLAEFDFLVVTIALQRETGGNLAETLAGLDSTLRGRRQLALKVRALAAEARASALIIGSLPFAMALLLWLTSPAYLVPLFTTTLGRALLGAGLASIAIGAFIISAMMKVKQ